MFQQHMQLEAQHSKLRRGKLTNVTFICPPTCDFNYLLISVDLYINKCIALTVLMRVLKYVWKTINSLNPLITLLLLLILIFAKAVLIYFKGINK